jgi:hypothetical protein
VVCHLTEVLYGEYKNTKHGLIHFVRSAA